MGETRGTAATEDGEAHASLLPELGRARRAAAAAAQRMAARERSRPAVEPAPALPVARVLVDLPLAHLDRPFDYLVPTTMHEQAVPGSRVKVRFAGQDVDGFVLERVAGSEHPRLATLRRAVSPEPVLTPPVARLAAALAERYAGTRSDVLRLAVPARHARVEQQPSSPAPPVTADLPAATRGWEEYTAGGTFVGHLAHGGSPRAVWSARPGERWPHLLAHAAAATAASGRGSLLCVPDRRDLDRLDAALTEVLGPGRHAVLAADLGPAARYRAFLAVARGAVGVVAGTRAAAFAPVQDLGLVALWDDGDDLYAEPRAPYPHTREVLLLRAHLEGCGALVGGFSRTVEAAHLVASGWARELQAPRETVRRLGPRIDVTGASDTELARDPLARAARIPSTAHAAIREGLARGGPVLVQAPRQGYAAALACDRCRLPARCRDCSGPLGQPAADRPPSCRWCGHEEPGRRCPECGAGGLRAPVVGERRTAEELGRAFVNVPVVRASGERPVAEVPDRPAIVVATPGAEPVPKGGYTAVVLLDTWLSLARPDLRTEEEALRRWLNAAALARGSGDGGRVVAVGDPAHPALQALVRWDPAGFAEREAAERSAAHLPPASRLAVISGSDAAVDEALSALALPPGAEVLGPVPVPALPGPAPATADSSSLPAGRTVRLVVRVPRTSGVALVRALRELQGVRAARKLPPVRVQVDPHALE